MSIHAQAPAVNFGHVSVCPAGQKPDLCSDTRTVTIQAAASANQTFHAVVLTEGVPNLDFRLSSIVCAGSSCDVSVVFRPQYPGLRRGMIELVTNAAGQVAASAPIYGIGLGGQLGFGFAQQTPVAVGLQVTALAVDGAGTLYYAHRNNGTISKLSSGGSALTIANGFSTSALALDGGGNLYVGDATDGEVLTIAPNGSRKVLVSGVDPTGIAVDGEGQVYVADKAGERILKIAVNGALDTIINGSVYSGVAVDGAGNVFTQNAQGQAIEISPNGVQSTVGSNLQPTAATLAVDAAGSIYTSNGETLLQLASSGQMATSGGTPSGVAIDSSGDLFYGDRFYERIVKVNRVPTNLFVNNQELPSPIGKPASPVSTFTIENTGNAPMTLTGATFANGPGRASFGCQTLQPGQRCALRVTYTGTEPNDQLSVGYSSNNQDFQVTVPITTQSFEKPALQTYSTVPSDGSPLTLGASISVGTATGTMTFTMGNSTCEIPLSAGKASCTVPSAAVGSTWHVFYGGDSVTETAKTTGIVGSNNCTGYDERSCPSQ